MSDILNFLHCTMMWMSRKDSEGESSSIGSSRGDLRSRNLPPGGGLIHLSQYLPICTDEREELQEEDLPLDQDMLSIGLEDVSQQCRDGFELSTSLYQDGEFNP